MADITEFNIGQGETFKIASTIQNVDDNTYFDITDYTFTGQVRENFSTDEVAANFAFTKLHPLNSGSFFVELTSEQTAQLTQRKYVYDIKMTSGSITRRIMEGYFVVRPAATR
jgi:hypothetical protein